MIKISISVVCFNSPIKQLKDLTDSIIAAVRFMRQRAEVGSIPFYLIDNSELPTFSLSELQGDFNELSVQTKLINGHGNIGYGCAHNLVLDEIASDYHLILNPDVILEEDALYQAITLIMSDNKRKMLGPSAVGEKGERQYLCKRYPSITTLLLRGILPNPLRHLFEKRLNHYEMRDLPEDRVTDDIPLLSGCFILIDTPTLKKVGGFDSGYFLYFEDFDLSLRVKKIGTLSYAPMVRITHAGGQASTKGLRHIVMFSLSALRFFGNYGWRVF